LLYFNVFYYRYERSEQQVNHRQQTSPFTSSYYILSFSRLQVIFLLQSLTSPPH